MGERERERKGGTEGGRKRERGRLGVWRGGTERAGAETVEGRDGGIEGRTD
jgi:hypothetical protein